jgi:hypothetical protein
LEASSDILKTSEEILRNSVSLNMPLVASPVSKKVRPFSAYFLLSWDDLEKDHVLIFHFNDDGRLCGLEVGTIGAKGSRVIGEKAPRFGSSVKVDVPAESWITGLELNIGNCSSLDNDAVIGVTRIKVNGRSKLVS